MLQLKKTPRYFNIGIFYLIEIASKKYLNVMLYYLPSSKTRPPPKENW